MNEFGHVSFLGFVVSEPPAMRFLLRHHDLVPALVLGTVECRIHSSQEPRARHAMLREDGNAQRECHSRQALSVELGMDLSGVLANGCGAHTRHFL